MSCQYLTAGPDEGTGSGAAAGSAGQRRPGHIPTGGAVCSAPNTHKQTPSNKRCHSKPPQYTCLPPTAAAGTACSRHAEHRPTGATHAGRLPPPQNTEAQPCGRGGMLARHHVLASDSPQTNDWHKAAAGFKIALAARSCCHSRCRSDTPALLTQLLRGLRCTHAGKQAGSLHRAGVQPAVARYCTQLACRTHKAATALTLLGPFRPQQQHASNTGVPYTAAWPHTPSSSQLSAYPMRCLAKGQSSRAVGCIY
mmetsp:Transcript_11520/g.28165  ORF Transcript_11520/g.28165 Transcript_11520/m.28165 type:complete len:253 (+) Transcript_11520:1034-1792(+)